MIILLHSSKTMRQADNIRGLRQPRHVQMAKTIMSQAASLDETSISRIMKLSPKLAVETKQLLQSWSATGHRPAIDSFLGDIYSGLQVQNWSKADRMYADEHLRILSGLYGLLRPLDAINPYRLEMGYHLPDVTLHQYWQETVSAELADESLVINLTSAEYAKAITANILKTAIAPRFLTRHKDTHQPTFVVVHAKIARGAYANWLIRNRVDDQVSLSGFDDLGYEYDAALSTPLQPTFVCQTFLGLGLSVRLS